MKQLRFLWEASSLTPFTCDDSDIDIAVEIEEKKKTLTNFFGLKRHLEEKLEKRIDLGIKGAMKPIVSKAAQKDMIYV